MLRIFEISKYLVITNLAFTLIQIRFSIDVNTCMGSTARKSWFTTHKNIKYKLVWVVRLGNYVLLPIGREKTSWNG